MTTSQPTASGCAHVNTKSYGLIQPVKPGTAICTVNSGAATAGIRKLMNRMIPAAIEDAEAGLPTIECIHPNRNPHTGPNPRRMYAYMRRGFGPVWGFLFGWMHSIVGRPASASSIAAGIMRFMSFLIPAVATPLFTVHIAVPGLTGWIKPYDFVFTWAQPLAVGWLVVMTAVNYLGVRLGGAVQ